MIYKHNRNGQALRLFIILLTATLSSGGKAITTEAHTEDPNAGNHNFEDTVDWQQSICLDFHGAYGRKTNLGVICCANETMFLPIEMTDNWESNPALEECTLESTKDKTSTDMSAVFWKVWFCILKESSAFPKDKVTFDNYFNFVTAAYPEETKNKIKKATASCKKNGDKAKENTDKLQKFTECLHTSEEQVCHRPFVKSEFSEKPKADADAGKDKTACAGMEGIYGADRLDYCCKTQSIPFDFLDFYNHFPKTDEVRERNDNCSEKFVNKQLELDPKLNAELTLEEDPESDVETNLGDTLYENATMILQHCTHGCQVLGKDFTDVKDLTLNYESAISTMLEMYGAKVRKDLEKLLLSRKSAFTCGVLNTGDDKRLTFAELEKKFKDADDMKKIRYFCGFSDCLGIEIGRGLHEYCLDADHADQWYKDHLSQEHE